METKTIRPIRNNANIRVVVPQFVNLTVYDYGFKMTVTFNINEYAMYYIHNHKDDHLPPAAAELIHTYQRCTSRGIRHYVTLERSYNDLNLIGYATRTVAVQDLRVLKILMREAKIAQLKNEIENI